MYLILRYRKLYVFADYEYVLKGLSTLFLSEAMVIKSILKQLKLNKMTLI